MKHSPSFDRTHREPMRAIDAIVTGKGERFQPNTNAIQWEVCPAIKETPKGEVDLTGQKFGRMTVIGLSAETRYTRWICRCACGVHEARRAKVIQDPAKYGGDKCDGCNQVAGLALKHRIKNGVFHR